MKWEKETAADIVMGSAAKVAEDMVHGAAASIQDITEYHSMYRNMATTLNNGARNLRKHVLGKKWMSIEDKKAVRQKISQIRAVARVCRRMQVKCSEYAEGSIKELKKMEMNKKPAKIVSRIETSPDD